MSRASHFVGSLGKGDPRAYPLIFESFKTALGDANNFQGFISAIRSIAALGDPRGQEALDLLEETFEENSQIIGYIRFLEEQFQKAIREK